MVCGGKELEEGGWGVVWKERLSHTSISTKLSRGPTREETGRQRGGVGMEDPTPQVPGIRYQGRGCLKGPWPPPKAL